MSGRLDYTIWLHTSDYTRGKTHTYYLEGNVSNHVFRTSAYGTWFLDKALNQSTIQFRGCNAPQSGCEGRSTCCFKPIPSPIHERTARTTRMRAIYSIVWQDTLGGFVGFVGFHSPVGGPIKVPINGAKKGEGIIGTSGQNCSQISSNITWREN